MTMDIHAEEFGQKLAVKLAERKTPVAPLPVSLPDEDDEHTLQHAGEGLGHAEGQSFMIEYENAKGEPSRRRVTVWSISIGASGVPCLVCFCHERKAMRSFRIDRIECFIDYDGVVHDDTAAFLREAFGISIEIAKKRQEVGRLDAFYMSTEVAKLLQEASYEKGERWASIMQLLKADAHILSAMSHADGFKHPEELTVMVQWCCRKASKVYPDLSEHEEEAIIRYLQRCRPQEKALVAACDEVLSRPVDAIVALVSTAKRVMNADGVQHPAEAELLEELAAHVCGRHGR
jgi:hypothetical protein